MKFCSRPIVRCLLLSAVVSWPTAGKSQSCELAPVVWSEGIFRRHEFDFGRQGAHIRTNAKSTFVLFGVEKLILDKVQSDIPPSTCSDRYTFHSPNFVVEGDKLRLAFAVKYENWSCAWIDGVCSRGAELYACRWETTNKLLDKTINFSLALSPQATKEGVSVVASLTNDASTDNLELIASALFPQAAPLFLWLASEFRSKFAPTVFDPKISLAADGTALEQFTLQSVKFDYVSRNPDQFALVVRTTLTKSEGAACFFRKVLLNAVADSAECKAFKKYVESGPPPRAVGQPLPDDPQIRARMVELEASRARLKGEFEKKCIRKN